MNDWWMGLSTLNQGFYCAAAVFSVPFLWSLAAAFFGLGGGADLDDVADAAADGQTDALFEHGAGDSLATMLAFKLVSVRALLTFFTLFSWGSALYLQRGVPVARALGISALWGAAGMVSVALILWLLPRLAYTGTRSLASCVGSEGTVYLDIPAQRTGEIRVTVSDAVSHVKARAAGGAALVAGTPVRVLRLLDPMTVEVEPVYKT